MGEISGDILRILWVKSNKLLPVHSGGDIRSYNIARQLARKHELTFLSYYDGVADAKYEQQLTEHFPGCVCIAAGKAQTSTLARGVDYMGRITSPLPYAVGRFACKQVQKTIRQFFDARKFDVAVCDFLDAAVNFPAQLSTISVLFQHNIEAEIWRRHAETESNPVKRRLYNIECRKMLRYERNVVKSFHHVIAVSEHDRSLMECWVEGSRITVVPTGVDLEHYKPDFSRKTSPSLVMFVGAMDWEPNVDAMQYFCREIWPAVLAQNPNARLRIVGRNPGERVRSLSAPSVEITGRVPSVLDHLREAAVVVVPLRIGGGTRLKIYEAMAAGKAVVSTFIGAEGLDVHHGHDIFLADGPKDFCDAVLTLLANEDLRHKYEVSAAPHAAQYDWQIVAEKFARALEIAVATGKGKTVPADEAIKVIGSAW
jgi:glycosyltransferase involved in cell wall biosynthesis